jgi:hypothetical protein
MKIKLDENLSQTVAQVSLSASFPFVFNPAEFIAPGA